MSFLERNMATIFYATATFSIFFALYFFDLIYKAGMLEGINMVEKERLRGYRRTGNIIRPTKFDKKPDPQPDPRGAA